jgi:RHS repeat-associated protein
MLGVLHHAAAALECSKESTTCGLMQDRRNAGNVRAQCLRRACYDDRNRLTTVTSGGNTIANYQYNGEGQRVWRTFTEPLVWWAATVYDPTGSGNLYGEYFTQNYREYVYLDGIPVASATDAGEEAPLINYLYADQLGTLRAVVASTGTSPSYTWPWLNDAFGDQPMQGTGAFYLRFPGQYFDVETGLNFNNNRNYDPTTGRYVQSDPIGLGGGISTYAYVGGDPLDYSDPLGLVQWQGTMTARGASAGVGGSYYKFVLDSECVNGKRAHVVVYAFGPTAGLNGKATAPGGVTWSSVTLNDRLDYVDPDALNGWFSYIGAGASSFKGYSFSTFQLGGNGLGLQPPQESGAWSAPSFGPESGFELGAGVTAGSSMVTESHFTSCGCDGK